MYNRVIFIGNLTKDPELRYAPQGTPIGSFRIAVTTRYKQSDEAKEETLFIDVVAFGRQAESCSQYLTKGRPVLVEGRLQERKWEYEGQKRSRMEVVAQNVRFLGSRRDGNGATDAPGDGRPAEVPDEVTEIDPF